MNININVLLASFEAKQKANKSFLKKHSSVLKKAWKIMDEKSTLSAMISLLKVAKKKPVEFDISLLFEAKTATSKEKEAALAFVRSAKEKLDSKERAKKKAESASKKAKKKTLSNKQKFIAKKSGSKLDALVKKKTIKKRVANKTTNKRNPFEKLSKKGLCQSAITSLSGYTFARVKQMTDDDLLKINGVSKKGLRILRESIK